MAYDRETFKDRVEDTKVRSVLDDADRDAFWARVQNAIGAALA